MEIIRNEQSVMKANSSLCTVWEYPSTNLNIDLAKATITGREPLKGRAENTECTELVRVEYGNGTITINDDEPIHIHTGDLIIIEPGEKFVWQGELKLIIVCTPPWNAEQHIVHTADNT